MGPNNESLEVGWDIIEMQITQRPRAAARRRSRRATELFVYNHSSTFCALCVYSSVQAAQRRSVVSAFRREATLPFVAMLDFAYFCTLFLMHYPDIRFCTFFKK
jgi:hypothetical protein